MPELVLFGIRLLAQASLGTNESRASTFLEQLEWTSLVVVGLPGAGAVEVPVIPERLPPLHRAGLGCDVAAGHLLAGQDGGEGHQLQYPLLLPAHQGLGVGQAGVIAHGVQRIEADTDPRLSQLEVGGVGHQDPGHLPDVLLSVVRQGAQLQISPSRWLRSTSCNFSDTFCIKSTMNCFWMFQV